MAFPVKNRITFALGYGHADQEFFRDQRHTFDALIVPASIATVFQQGTGGFVLTLGKDYFIDPRTPIFQADFPREALRSSHHTMASMHGSVIEQVYDTRPVMPRDFATDPTIREVAHSVLEFQKSFVQTSSSKLAKYAKILGEEVEESYEDPALLVSPYFCFDTIGDEWYRVSLRIAQASATEKGTFRLFPVICVNPRCLLTDPGPLLQDYSDHQFDGLFVLVNGFKEWEAPTEQLSGLNSWVQVLSTTKKPIITLAGSYVSALLWHKGMSGLCHGVGYGESRDVFAYEGGRPADRYYIPKLHRFYDKNTARIILGDTRVGNALNCTCDVCTHLRAGGLVDFGRFEMHDFLAHFINSRRAELDHVEATSLTELVAELYETIGLARRSFSVQQFSSHLDRWAAALM